MIRDMSALGDAALLAPASGVVLLFFLVTRRRAVAAAFAAMLALGIGATLLSKLIFKTCGSGLPDLDVASPSGHVSFATMVYGSLAIVFATGRPAWLRVAIALAAGALLVGIGWSRVATGSHSADEVAVGFLIGAAALAVFLILYRRSGSPRVPPWPLLAGFAVVAALLVGRHMTIEPVLGRFARDLRTALDACEEPPRRRAAWHGLDPRATAPD